MEDLAAGTYLIRMPHKRKRKNASVQVSNKLQKHNPKFMWVKFRGTPVLWPVKFVNEDEDGIHVYVQSEDAVMTVTRKDMLPFPGDIDEIKKNGLVKLKKRKDTLNAFICDIDWCLTGCEMVERESDLTANSEPDLDFFPRTSNNDEDFDSISSVSVCKRRKCGKQDLSDEVTTSNELPSSFATEHAKTSDEPHAFCPLLKEESFENETDLAGNYSDLVPGTSDNHIHVDAFQTNHDETSDESHAPCPLSEEEPLENESDLVGNNSDLVPETFDNDINVDAFQTEQYTAVPVYNSLNTMKQSMPHDIENAINISTPNLEGMSEPSSFPSNHDETSDESHAPCPLPGKEPLENESYLVGNNSDLVPETFDNDINVDAFQTEQYTAVPVYNSLNTMKQSMPHDIENAINISTPNLEGMSEPSSFPSYHDETSDESHAPCPLPGKEPLENESDLVGNNSDLVPETFDNDINVDAFQTEQYTAVPVYNSLNTMKQSMPHDIENAINISTPKLEGMSEPSSFPSNHDGTSDESHAPYPLPGEEPLENESDLAENDSVADSDFVPETSDNDFDSETSDNDLDSISSELSSVVPVNNNNRISLNSMSMPHDIENAINRLIPLKDMSGPVHNTKKCVNHSITDEVKNTKPDELPSNIIETRDESHASRPVQEEERLYSNNCKIYIKKYTKINEKSQTGRKFDCIHACCFCKRLYTNIQVHLEHHSAKSEIQEIKKLKQKEKCAPSDAEKQSVRKEVKRLQTILRNKGDHIHNQSVVKRKEGELLIARRKQGNFNHKEYGCCPECLEWIRLKENYKKHRNNCASKNKSSDSIAHVQQFIFEGKVCPEASKHLKEEVFPSMMTGQISETAMSDVLIISLGEFHFMSNIANKVRRKNYTSYRMRLAARLLHLLRQDLNMPDLSFLQALIVENFDAFIRCSLEACGINEDEELEHPSTALKLGYDIARLTAAKGTYAIKRRDEQQRKDAADFAFLVQDEWKLKVKKRAVTLLEGRQFNKPILLPAPQDIATLAKYLVTSLKELVLDVDPIIFNRVAVLTEARLLLYNRRRPGELEAFNISTYHKRSTQVDETDLSLRSELSKLEKMLLDSQELVEIRGKCNNRVPIILPAEVKEPLKYLADPDVRIKCGIKKNNPYMFANTGDLAVRAGEALNIVKYEVDLKLPQRILATNLRKHTATISQVMGLEDHQLRWLVNHMGHTEKVHLQNYRSTSGLIERLDIAKIMLMQEKNVVGSFAGVRLDDIRFEDLDDEQGYVDGGVASLDTEIAEPDIAHANSIVSETRDSSECEDVVKTKKKKPSRVKRVPWTKNEIKEVEMYFKDYVDLKATRKCPGMKDCMYAIQQSKVKGGLLCKRSWETIKKKVAHIMMMKRREIL